LSFILAQQHLGTEGRVTGELWTVRTSYNSKGSLSWASSGNINSKLGLASTMGKLIIYDLRNTDIAVCEADIGRVTGIQPCTDNPNSHLPVINFSPDVETQVSLSGFDEHVYIYDVSCTEKFKTIFVHDGHLKQSGQVKCCVTSHIWYKENTVISASDNSGLHCWQFIPDALP
jgi:WD40 repeat protein